MLSSLYILILTLFPGAAPAAEKTPIIVQYAKTGRETLEQIEQLGKTEVENGNPCVSRMMRELNRLADTKEMRESVAMAKGAVDPKITVAPAFVLSYANEAMDLGFELREAAHRDDMGIMVPLKVHFQKRVELSSQPGTWKERMDSGACVVGESAVRILREELSESERLKNCVARKQELLDASKKVRNYLHSYIPVHWIEEARLVIAKQSQDSRILRQDVSIYQDGNDTYKKCARGLKLLEEEAASSLRVLQEVTASKLQSSEEVPAAEIKDLERRLKSSTTAQ